MARGGSNLRRGRIARHTLRQNRQTSNVYYRESVLKEEKKAPENQCITGTQSRFNSIVRGSVLFNGWNPKTPVVFWITVYWY